MSGDIDVAALARRIAETSAAINSTYPADVGFETRVYRRTTNKLAEELGELAEAIGGALGENPRKGVTHSWRDVSDELLDVAACALGAWEFVNGHNRQCVAALDALVERKFNRLVDAIEKRATS